ncbi:MAG: LysM peptidoglycan-binding domain-containing protein [Aurantimonas endophytica]|uniref:Nucleoid-associated protein YgaU n=1 Tax=Aurantimonas endophytica TaxID=1522175 RepID=A0A7W6H9T3_9HYPH|nr:LysM peptidoglycan-binding domain-containing protein [Aurantimonas endophytica]MBB4001003.1 nucleoid-associated protein YgaU [Aurantimonas endophytica]MCO6403341.1 LysM peptidoglycan-binding domain-containing protein [Aurantimonas endophytica]
MQRKVVGILLVCVVLLVAIIAGYWDMLQSESLRISNPPQETAEDDVALLPEGRAMGEDVPREGGGRPAQAPAGETASQASPGGSVPPADSSGDTTSSAAAPEAAEALPADATWSGGSAEDIADPVATAQDLVAPTESTEAGAPAKDPAAPAVPVPDDAAADDADALPSAATGASDAAAAPASPAGAAPADADASEVTPRFDLLRVEPDGATVIAGRAAPGSRIALRDGEATIGTDTANASGEFAIVLENALEPGDHAIRITATGENGAVASSEEIAIVSVPQPGREGELLAMVEAPNEASRLISIPAFEPRNAAPPPSTSGATETASAPAGAETRLAAPAADPAAPDAVTLPRAAPQSPVGVPATVPMLRVEAVEIEAGKVFVAGAAEAGALVRVYIDNVLLAEERASPKGRFLVSADTPVAPGDHVVRADQVTRDGSVQMRAEVPFQRPAGESVAMVAPPPAIAPEADSASGDDRDAARAAAPGEASAGSAAPSSASGAGTGNGLQARTSSPDDAVATPVGPGEASSQGGRPVTVAEIPPGDAAGDPVATGENAADQSVATPAPPATSQAASAPPAGTSAPAAAAPTPAGGRVETLPADSADAASEQVPVSRQDALTTAQGRVIIRRGDSLWRISRETYGMGSRYVVIYLANGDQIRNPHLIYPGQVFSVPNERVETPEVGDRG